MNLKFLNFEKKKKPLKIILEAEIREIHNSSNMLFKKEDYTDFWETLTQNQKDEILKGIEEIENGETVNYENFIKKYRK